MKNKLTLLSIIILFFVFFANILFADPATPYPVEVTQPDGSKIEIQLHGDEFYSWAEDTQGYTVLQNSTTKEWVYAKHDENGSLKATSYRIGKAAPQTLGVSRGIKDRNYIQIREKNISAMRPPGWDKREWLRPARERSYGEQSEGVSEAPANPIVKKTLVILVQFADTKFTTPDPQQAFQNLMTQPGYRGSGASGITTVGSIKEYFSATSYGNYIVDAVVSPVITLNETSAWYVGASRYEKVGSHLVPEALKKLEAIAPNIFAQCATNGWLDSLTIIYAGHGQSSTQDPTTIWPHASYVSGNSEMFKVAGIKIRGYNCSNELRSNRMVGIGTIAHEISHELFGLPDLYDTSSPSTHEGLGEFCLMSGGSHCGNGYTPPLWSPWCKKKVGVATIINMPDNADILILDSALNDGNIYKIKGPGFYTGTGQNAGKEEYFLLENRNGGGFDQSIPHSQSIGRGILIWHIDESQPDNRSPYAARLMVGLEEANGQKELISNRKPIGVYFKASSNASYNYTAFTDTTTPNSTSYDGKLAGKPITNISLPGSAMTFRVGNGNPSLGIVSTISPAECKRGTPVNIAINGANLKNGSTVKLTNGSVEIPASNVTYTSDAKLTAAVNIPENSVLGAWDLIVSHNGYDGGVIIKPGIFTVKTNPVISSVSGNNAVANKTLNLNIIGSDFQNGVAVKLSDTINGFTIINGTVTAITTTSISVTFDIPPEVVGIDFDLTVTNNDNSYAVKTNVVHVYESVIGSINSISPASSNRGSSVSIAVNGKNLQPESSVWLSNGSDIINAETVTYDSSNKLIASFVIPSSAEIGYWDIRVSNDMHMEDLYKSNAFFVHGNMLITSIDKTTFIRGASYDVSVKGAEYESGATIKLTNGNMVINGAVTSITATEINAVFEITSDIAHNTKFDVTVTNENEDYITKIGALTVCAVPEITSFTPSEAEVDKSVSMTITGKNFVPGLTGIKIRRVSGEGEIAASVSVDSATSINAVFSTAKEDAGQWELYVQAYEGGPEYSGGKFMIYSDETTHRLGLKESAEIRFTVKSADGQRNEGTAKIPYGTFNSEVSITIKQHYDLAPADSHVSKLTHTNLGIHFHAEGNLPDKEIFLKIPYNQSDTDGINEESLVITRYNETAGKWIPVKSWREDGYVCAYIDHLSIIAVMGTEIKKGLDDVRYYPNPLRPSKGLNYSRMHFANLPEGAKIKIYTMLGQTVKELSVDGSGMALWDGKNENGEFAASGVYIAYIEDKSGNKKKIKIAVER